MDQFEEVPESINLRPNRPEKYSGKRDFLIINTWIYKIDQYLSLMQISNPGTNVTEECQIMFASSFLTETAAVWWFTLVQNATTPSTWQEFKQALMAEFLPEDHIRRARDRLRRVKQKGSASEYIAEFRNIILAVPDISEGEKFDRFIEGLKPNIKVEVMKSTVTTFEEATKMALRVDSALWRESINWTGRIQNYSDQHGSASNSSDPVPMEIGNVHGKKRMPLTQEQRAQRARDTQNNACFTCHRKGCRPWKCSATQLNNSEVHAGNEPRVEAEENNISDSESENK